MAKGSFMAFIQRRHFLLRSSPYRIRSSARCKAFAFRIEKPRRFRFRSLAPLFFRRKEALAILRYLRKKRRFRSASVFCSCAFSPFFGSLLSVVKHLDKDSLPPKSNFVKLYQAENSRKLLLVIASRSCFRKHKSGFCGAFCGIRKRQAAKSREKALFSSSFCAMIRFPFAAFVSVRLAFVIVFFCRFSSIYNSAKSVCLQSVFVVSFLPAAILLLWCVLWCKLEYKKPLLSLCAFFCGFKIKTASRGFWCFIKRCLRAPRLCGSSLRKRGSINPWSYYSLYVRVAFSMSADFLRARNSALRMCRGARDKRSAL